MQKLLFLLFLLWGSNLFAQVCNGDFEQIDPTVPTYNYTHQLIDKALCWKMYGNTADLYHTAYSAGNVTPHSGDGYAHMFGASGGGGIEPIYNNTTIPLTAGQSYNFSCYFRVRYWDLPETDAALKIYLIQANPANLPYTTMIATYDPVFEFPTPPDGSDYVHATGCFTPDATGDYYLICAPSGIEGDPNPMARVGIYLDDISITQAGPTAPTAVLSTAQPSYCVGDAITISGAASSGETEYFWRLFRVTNGGNEELVYTSGTNTGTVGNLDVNEAFTASGHIPAPGFCYKVYVTVMNGCSDEAVLEFCYDDPRIQFITDGDPVCENVPIELEVTGDNGWTYEWSTGESGVGMKSITVTPTAPSVQYTVTVTTAPPASCEFTQTLNLVVSSLVGQVAPTMDGIDGTNEYTYYAQSGDVVDFSSLISNNAGEVVMSSFTNINVPGNYSFTLPPINSDGGAFSFNWQTPINSAGSYSFTVDLLDKNGCMPLSNSYTFTIILICDYCPVCIAYDNRTPETFPVPPYTKAGKCIEVAFNDVVRIGAGNSATFQAGDYVAIDPVNFDTDGGTFDVIIDPTTCIEACDDCCSEWNGFTLDLPLPNIISLQSTVGNEIWYVRDDDNPWCAFGATGFELYVLNEWGGTVYKQLSYEGLGCCPFRALGFPSSINWDGRTNVGFNQGEFVSNGVYFYVLYLHGCGQTAMYSGDITVSGSSGMIIQDQSTAQAVEQPFAPAQTETAAVPGNGLPANHFFVFPNPTEGIVRIHASEELQNVQVFDAGGKLVIERSSDFDLPIDLTLFSPGSYRIRTTLANQQIKENTIVKE